MALSREEIQTLLNISPSIVRGILDPELQIQPNGIDLTLGAIARVAGPGALGPGNERSLATLEPLEFGPDGSLHLEPGPYLITVNEVVHLPRHVIALGRPRSSLLRSGVALHTAVWDAGYQGRSQALMMVYNPHGFRVSKDTSILQLVFFYLSQPVAEGYKGFFQGENL